MKSRTVITIAALGLPTAGAIIFCALFVRCAEMKSSSMEPTIYGRKNPTGADGDFVFYTTSFPKRGLRSNDLVIVEFTDTNSGSAFRTPRRLAEVVGGRDGQAGAETRYRVTADSTNGLDSTHFGLSPERSIKGKIFYILRSR